MVRLLLVLLALAWCPAEDPSPVNQVFQFRVAGTCTAWSDGQPSKATSYLWIPEGCQRLRGLLILCNNVPEHRLVGHAAIRRVCTANDLGIVWNTPSFMNFKRTEPGKPKMSEEWTTAVRFLQQQLDALAAASGYAEVATVPWLPLGESGHLLMVDALVETAPERCIAGVWIKNHHLPPKNRTTPALVIYGSAQEWGQEKTDLRTKWTDVAGQYRGALNERTKHPAWPFTYVLDGASGHFDCSERLTAYIASYLDAVVRARLDPAGALRPLRLEDGVTRDLAVPEVPAGAAAPWYPTSALADEAQAIAAIDWQAATQFPVTRDGQSEPLPHDFNGIQKLTAVDLADDLSFTVPVALAPAIPAGFVAAGTPLAQGPAAPEVEWLCGPLEPLGGNRFRISLDRVWLGGGATYLGLRAPAAPGIRGICQPLAVDLKALRITDGQPQKIAFPPPADLHPGAAPVPLVATSDAGLPVSFFVVAGPAIVRNGHLELTPIPPRTRLPVEVTVAAWQWGRKAAPAVKMAEIVQRTLRVGQ